jgi:hypothetical protein
MAPARLHPLHEEIRPIAQALGDFTALKQRRRRALRVNLGSDCAGGLQRLAAAIQN